MSMSTSLDSKVCNLLRNFTSAALLVASVNAFAEPILFNTPFGPLFETSYRTANVGDGNLVWTPQEVRTAPLQGDVGFWGFREGSFSRTSDTWELVYPSLPDALVVRGPDATLIGPGNQGGFPVTVPGSPGDPISISILGTSGRAGIIDATMYFQPDGSFTATLQATYGSFNQVLTSRDGIGYQVISDYSATLNMRSSGNVSDFASATNEELFAALAANGVSGQFTERNYSTATLCVVTDFSENNCRGPLVAAAGYRRTFRVPEPSTIALLVPLALMIVRYTPRRRRIGALA